MSGTRFVVEEIEKAISDEWMAHYQYFLGAVIIDPKYEDVMTEFVEHSSQEYDHATELASWLWKSAERGSVPLSLDLLVRTRHCGYTVPRVATPSGLLQDNINAETCAVEFYTGLLRDLAGRGGYFGTEIIEILGWILDEEKKHLRDLQELKLRY